MPEVTMKQLLEAGVHFGHQTKRWNPKMKKYIFGARNGIYIIDLQKTLRLLREACDFVRDVSEKGGYVLFVGTKKQVQETIAEEAKRCGGFYVDKRWLGGTLTNFSTITINIDRLKRLETSKADGSLDSLTKKEGLRLEKQRLKLERSLSGIRDMDHLPGAVFVIDTRKEKIAVHEGNKLGIPVIAVVDTNCDPDGVDYVIPGNDDGMRAVRLFASKLADAVLEGKNKLEREMLGEEVAAPPSEDEQAGENEVAG